MILGRATDKSSGKLLAVLAKSTGQGAVEILDSLSRATSQAAASSLLQLLTHMTFPEPEAREIVLAAFQHRDFLREKLGRDVGVRVALFDLMVGVERKLPNPKIIDLPTFERIERSATTDHLTNLYNRSHFEERLHREMRRAERFDQHLALVILDIDDFKAVNDGRGHLVGDAVLREVGRLIVESVRDIDIAARYGGEEFTVILPETRRNGAFIVAERIRSEMESHFRRRGALGRALKATLSGGLACFPEDAEGPEGLIARADEALYRAKKSGKNLIAVYFEEKRRDERITIEERKLKAILLEGGRGGAVRHSGLLKNVSEGGLLLELSRPVPVGREMQVSFSLGVQPAYRFPCTVVRLDEHGSNGGRRRFEAGLRFQRRARILQPQLTRLARRQAAVG